jgi:predicted methyltransferase
MSITADVLLSLHADEAGAGNIHVSRRVTRYDYTRRFTDGQGASQAEILYSDSRTASSGSFTILLSAITDTRNGQSVTVNFFAVKVIFIRNTHATNNIVFSGAFTATIKPGGAFALVDPTADGVPGSSLFVTTTAGTTFDIVIIGEGTVNT